MIAQIETAILPRLEKDVPGQPTEEELLQHEQLHKFMIVCDRECYSVDFFHSLWEKRIAVCTYNKNVKDKWPQEDFAEYEMVQEDGTKEKITLCEKTVTLKNNDKQNPKQVACREIRKLSKSGHQTSILTTNWVLGIVAIGFYMFARWCQENFFLYMKQNFDIDGLVSYSKEAISDTKMLVNPAYRQLESQSKSLNGKLSKQKTLFANTTLKEGSEKGKKLERSIAKKQQYIRK